MRGHDQTWGYLRCDVSLILSDAYIVSLQTNLAEPSKASSMANVDRRWFLGSASFVAGATLLSRAERLKIANLPVIMKISILQVPGDFFRPVAMNAYDKRPVGKNGAIRIVRASLSDGTYGLGVEGYVPIREAGLSFLKRMIGVSPEAVFVWQGDHIVGYAPEFESLLRDEQNCWFELVLLDLIGKLKGRPVYSLFGPSVRDGIDAYDGSLYFVDVATGKGAEQVGQLAKAIRADGYRGLKIKIGRPLKWMPGEAGVVRDIEAVIAAREAVGANMNLMADANNGYQGHFDWAVRLLRECSPYGLNWIEEIFPETVQEYGDLLHSIREINADTPVADGESVRNMDAFIPFLENGLYRYIQPDMRTCGFSKVLYAADLAMPYRANVAPHNWMSELGKLACLHAAKIKRNIPLVEDDRYHDFAFDSSAYAFRDGQWFVPEKPGWGIELSPEYDYFAKAGSEIVIV
jgi:L-alanine-DL-glutamate epimerase-like enolase superfamily enzyme